MPPKKKNNQKKKPKNNNTKGNTTSSNKKKTAASKDDDELLNTLMAENEMLGGGGGQHGMLQAPFGRKPEDELTPAEEQRRIADASVLQNLALEQLERPKRSTTKKAKQQHYPVPHPEETFNKAKELLLKALYVLAGQHQRVPTSATKDANVINNAARIPPLFIQQQHEDILTPKLLAKAEDIFCVLLRDIDEYYRQVRSDDIADALLGLTYSGHTLRTDTNSLIVEVFRRVGRYEEAVEILQHLALISTGERAQHFADKLDKVEKEMEQVQNQMGESELACPICLGDCLRPCRPIGCPHIACEVCLEKHLDTSKFCPVCRNPTRSLDPVSDSEQVLYYFKRLNRDIDDAVAFDLCG